MASFLYICEYYYGNATDSKDVTFHVTNEEAVEYAVNLLSSGKYSLGDSEDVKADMREKLNKKGLYGDGSTCYRPEGLTYARVFKAYAPSR